MKIINANVFFNGTFQKLEVRFDATGILEVGETTMEDEVIDAKGLDLYPGLIDCHNHGGWFCGFMYQEPDEYGTFAEKIRYLSEKLPSCGVTTVFPTLAGTDYERIAKSVREIRKLRDTVQGAEISQFHFEGIYPSLKRYMTKEAVNPSIEHTDWLVDSEYSDVSMIHVSPDLPGTLEWCDYLVEKGVMPTVGNTQASAFDVYAAADHGLCQADHMYNGFAAMHHRENGAAVGVLLDDRIKAQLTCDGYHVSESFIRLIIKCKGIENIYGVTDMSEASGLPEGEHVLPNGKKILAKNGLIYAEDGYINSGNMTMNETLRAARTRCHLSKEEVGLLYAENVAKCLNLSDRGKIEAGRKADFTLMDDDYNVYCTIREGKVINQKAE
ncbi:MAG: amidohydrolase family protein [Erysipelotrichaceae bacterium]|nr:amidohydrolase family protein [Erysipelotrichaceae bacterium]